MKKTRLLAAMTLGLVTVLMFSFLPSCRKEKKSELVNNSGKLTLFTRESDPRIAQVAVDNGYYVDFLAAKTAKAVPTDLTSLSVHNADFSDETSIILKDNKLQRMSLSDGTQLVVNSVAGGTYNITLTTADGAYQLNTDLSTDGVKANNLNAVAAKNVAVRKGLSLQRVSNPVKPKVMGLVAHDASSLVGVEIDITKCGGIPADADAVYLNVYKKLSGNYIKAMPKIPAVHSATGLYFAAVPGGLATDYVVTGSDACKFTLDAIEDIEREGAKGLFKVIGKLLLDESIAVTVNSPVIPQSVPEYLKKFSDALNKVQSATDLLGFLKDDACNQTTLEDYKHNYGGLTMIAEAQAPGGGKTLNSSSSEPMDSNGPFPAMRIDLGSMASINNIDLSPSSPAAGQSYTATAYLNCLPVGTVLTIGVQGTDGYADGYQTTVSASDVNDPYVLSLQVPGAGSAGIKDVITVTLMTPSNVSSTKSNYLIFQ